MTYHCWSCVEREVDQPLHRCHQCKEAERLRFFRAKSSTTTYKESTHERYRAPIEDAERQSYLDYQREGF